jgi:alkanesulfonate monooxygenase
MAGQHEPSCGNHTGSVGQQRLLERAERVDVLDSCLCTAPGRYGGGGAGTTWLVGAAGDARIGDQLLDLLRESQNV